MEKPSLQVAGQGAGLWTLPPSSPVILSQGARLPCLLAQAYSAWCPALFGASPVKRVIALLLQRPGQSKQKANLAVLLRTNALFSGSSMVYLEELCSFLVVIRLRSALPGVSDPGKSREARKQSKEAKGAHTATPNPSYSSNMIPIRFGGNLQWVLIWTKLVNPERYGSCFQQAGVKAVRAERVNRKLCWWTDYWIIVGIPSSFSCSIWFWSLRERGSGLTSLWPGCPWVHTYCRICSNSVHWH